MADRTLTFATSRQPDPALRQDARYRFDGPDRQSIDNQVRAAQTFLSKDVLNGVAQTYVPFVGADGAVGDVVCSAGGLNGKPTVTLATTGALATSGVMFGILTEACLEGNAAHVAHSGILGPEITGLAAGDEGWVRVNANRCEKVAVLADEDICVGWVDSGGFLRVGSQPIASVTGAAPTTAKYLIAASTVPAELTQAVAAEGLTSTFLFASASVAPVEMRRTDAATAADVDVGYLEALSTSTTAAGFGPALRFYAKKGSGGSETLGTVSIAWTNVGAGTEASKFVAKARTAGGAAATVFEASGTSIRMPGIATGVAGILAIDEDGDVTRTDPGGLDADAHVLEDATTALGVNGVPMRAAPSTVGFVGVACAPTTHTHKAASSGSVVEALGVGQTITGGGGVAAGNEGVCIAWRLPDGFGALTVVGTDRVQYTSVLGATVSAKRVWAMVDGGTLTDRMTLSSLGVLSVPAGLTATSLDASSAGALTLGGTNATSIAVSSLKITGLAAGTASGHAVEYDQMNTAIGAAAFVPTARTLTGTSPITIAGDNSAHDLSADRAIAFSVTADVPWAGHGITGIASLDNSGSTQTIGANTTAMTIGKSATVATFAGGVTINGTNSADVLIVKKNEIGTTKSVGIGVSNTTVSGSQVTPQIGGSAAHSGGTVHSWGVQLEPQSAGRAIWRLCYGTGAYPANVPASTGFLLDTSDGSYGTSVQCNAFVSTGGTGFRMSVGGGGVKENGGTGQVNFYSASTSIGALHEAALATGDSDPCWDFYASAGTRTAGKFVTVRDGGGEVFAISSATATRGQVSINGIPIGWNIVSTAVNATVAIGDRVHVAGGGITITLPAVPSVVSTRDCDIIVLESSGSALGSPITVAAAGGDLINGAASISITLPNSSVMLCHDGDGTNWRIVGSHLL